MENIQKQKMGSMKCISNSGNIQKQKMGMKCISNSGNIQKFLDIVPEKIRLRVLRSYASWKFRRYMKSRLGNFYIDVDPYPVAPKELIMKTALMIEQDIQTRTSPDFHLYGGYSLMFSWLNILERYGFNIRTVDSIMEFGCGTARLIRHLRCIRGINLVGTDLDKEMVEWSTKNIPGVVFHQNDLKPPLKFADNDIFDLVYASSVFTHIPEETQNIWVQELHRIIRPGGFLLCDVAGLHHQQCQLEKEQIDIIDKKGVVTLTKNDNKASYSTKIVNSWDIFQPRGEILRVFGSSFIAIDYIPGILDLLVLKKPEIRH